MKRIIGIVLICAMTAGMVTACAPTIVVPETEPTETTAEAAVRPQDDYYRYINGDRLKNAKFEPGESSAGDPFNMEQIDDQIEGIIKDTVAGSGYAKGSEEDIIKTAYNAFMQYDFSNEPIPEDLAEIISDIDNVQSVDELMNRLLSRGTESQEAICKRIERAVEEAGGIEDYDYIYINDQIDDCADRMNELIRAQRNRTSRNSRFIEEIRQQISHYKTEYSTNNSEQES